MKIMLLAYAACLACSGAEAAANPRTTQYEIGGQPAAAEQSAATDDVQLSRDRRNRMTAPVKLGAAGPFQFLVDTGSDRTAISRELASLLGLAPGKKALLHSSTGQSEVAMVVVPELTLSRKAVRDIASPLLDRMHIGADGILGIDSLRAQRVSFDFRSQTMSISSGRAPVAGREEEGAIIVRARRREGRLMIADVTADGQRLKAIIDTGSDVSVGNAALRRRLAGKGKIQILGPIELVSVTGAILPGEIAIVRELEIGGITLQDLALVFADAHTFRVLDLDDEPAMLLGMDALRSFDKVSIDFASKKLRFFPPPSARTQ